MTIKEQIIDTLRATGRENMENVIRYMEQNGFFTRYCHRHHRYVGGLADHAWQTYQLALAMDEERVKKNPNQLALDKASLSICTLLHDFCNCHDMRHIRGHGQRSAAMLKELGLHLSSDEFLAIRFHMSLERHVKHPLYEDAKRCNLRYWVHRADGKSAKIGNGTDITLSHPLL